MFDFGGGLVPAFLVHSVEEVHDDHDVLELNRFISQERDPITGYRHWVESPGEAEHYDKPYAAHQDALIYGGVVVSERDLHRLGIRAEYDALAVAGWVKLEPSTIDLAP
jgi:hypothetical protein